MDEKEKKFKPHMMYGEKGKEEMAETYQEHLDLEGQGMGHDAPTAFKMGGFPLHYGTSPMMKKNAAGKEQGADGKACWEGYKYAGTENGKDKCVPM